MADVVAGDSKVKILFVLPSLGGGGAERVTLSLLNTLDRARWKPILLVMSKDPGVLEGHLPADVEVIRASVRQARYAFATILRSIWSRRPGIVFVTLDHMNALVGLMRPFLPRSTRVVLRVTDFGSLQIPRLRRLLGPALRMADLVIYQSDAMEREFRRRFWLGSRHSGSVVPNAVMLDRVRSFAAEGLEHTFDRKRLVIVAAGRLVRNKGFDLLIDAVSQIRHLELHLSILGDGPLRTELREHVERLGLADRISFRGFQHNPYAWFARADLFVLSSRFEGFPNVMLEALACGTPVIATPLPGLESLPGVTLTKNVSATAIACEIAAWFSKRPEFPADEVGRWITVHDAVAVSRQYEKVLSSFATIEQQKAQVS